MNPSSQPWARPRDKTYSFFCAMQHDFSLNQARLRLTKPLKKCTLFVIISTISEFGMLLKVAKARMMSGPLACPPGPLAFGKMAFYHDHAHLKFTVISWVIMLYKFSPCLIGAACHPVCHGNGICVLTGRGD
jgi:hypothetical protein